MKQGEKITVYYTQVANNSNKKNVKSKMGIFIRDYGSYIQIYDKYNIRTSIMKQDIVKIERVKNENI